MESTIGIKGFGAFDGAYFIESATHIVSRDGGYTTSLELRRGAKEGKKKSRRTERIVHDSLLK